ncbi:MAG: tetratricopeptide repeat protein [Sandaracinus sp.]|nr:tetratricopeptide repeat protein [Myxococcales bacterium]MCB9611744.1 tetratricopeptide repeat protein [Sandaracinus sp.]MCB9622389.1 tetratricopeptide repeat protein [Sandaracinus sp.]
MRVLAVFLLLVASPVFAQPSASDERARELYLVGDDLYSQGRYEEALAAFEEAYRLSERPLLLFNIANAQERSGQWQGAIESLEGYLPHADEAERARIESRIESLRRRVARLEAMQQVPEGNEREPEPTPTPEEPGPSLAGPLVLAAGGALLAGGITSAILAKGARDSLESECVVVDGRRLCGDTSGADRDRDLRASVIADVLFVASAAAVGVGLWLLLRGDDEDESPSEPDAQVGAAVSPNAAALVVRGRF